jgi:stearoyl-CoA desaturase (delta-9 desaturase)
MAFTTPTKTWTRKPDEKIALTRSIPFLLVHLAAILGVFLVGFSWKGVILCATFYYARMFFISAAFHRYFAHRAFKTSRFFQFLLALGGTTSAQKGVLWWAGHHRNHHRFSDQEEDIHSPLQRGFWWSHAGWILCLKYDETPDTIKDFAKYPELQWLNKNFLVPPFALAILMYFVWGDVGLFWGFFLSTVLLWHGTFTVNSLMHVFGKRRYETTDTSRNNAILGFVTLGENWHNNHHYYQASANQGFYWWEIDIAYYVIRALAAVGIVWDVRTPPQRVLDGGRTRDAAIAIEAEAQREVEAKVATVTPTSRKLAA